MGAAYRLCASFLVMLTVYGFYTWVVVPWIEPPTISAAQPAPSDASSEVVEKRDLRGVFPAGSWQLDQPKLLETGKGMLLFSEFDRLEDGRIKLTPCSLVLFSAAKSPRDKNKGRPIVLDAPSGAILNADPDMDMTGPNLTRIEGGHLLGEVAIYGPPSKPGVNDSIAITTRTVQFSKQKIWTTNAVKFQFGPHIGSGRDLAISLVQQGNVRKRTDQPLFAAGVTKMELVHLDHIDMEITDDILAEKKSREPGPRKQKPIPARIICQGPFTFDVPSKTATFEEQVQVAIKHRNGVIDQLLCPDRLTIEFEKPRLSPSKTDDTKKAGKSVGSLGGMRPVRVLAKGNPARMIARSAEADISAQNIAYFPTSRRVEFTDSNAVSVRHLGYRIRAPRVEYTLHRESKRLGTLEASGPGTLDGFRKVGGKTQNISGQWRGDLRIRRDSTGQPVLSLHDGAHVGIEDTGQFTAQNVFVWLKETKKARQAPKQAGLTPVDTNQSPKADYELRVDRVGAYGQVAFDTPQLVGGTDSLEMWMRYTAGPTPVAPLDGTKNEKDKPKSTPAKAQPKPPKKKPSSRYRLAGRRVQMQVTKVGDADPVVNDVTIDGEVKVTEIAMEANPRDALNVSGDMVRLSRNDVRDERPSSMEIQGRPAQVAMNGATMIGREIRFDQPTNRIWIDGAGEMVIPPKEQRKRGAQSPPIRITWEGGMQFNGGRMAIVGNVRTQGVHRLKAGSTVRYTVRADKLDVTMTRFVDFKAAMKKSKSQVKVEPNNLIFAGSVVMDGEGLDEYGQRASLEHMEVTTLTLNTKSEAVRADGPGWVSSLRFEGDAARKFQPNVRISARKRKQLVYLRTAFRRTMEGNYGTQQVQFLGDVQTVYGPVPDWNTRLNVDRPGGLGPDGILVRCERLLVVQEKTKDAEWMDVTASGNSQVENEAFRAQAERITYTQLKDRLVLEGSRDYARMWLTRSMSSKPDVVARKVTYVRKTNQVKSEDTRSINIQNFNGLLK